MLQTIFDVVLNLINSFYSPVNEKVQKELFGLIRTYQKWVGSNEGFESLTFLFFVYISKTVYSIDMTTIIKQNQTVCYGYLCSLWKIIYTANFSALTPRFRNY